MADLTELEVDGVYRLKPKRIGTLDYARMYSEGRFIHVRVLSGPHAMGYHVTTRGKDGEHLGPGGGWTDNSALMVWPAQVEEIPKDEAASQQ